MLFLVFNLIFMKEIDESFISNNSNNYSEINTNKRIEEEKILNNIENDNKLENDNNNSSCYKIVDEKKLKLNNFYFFNEGIIQLKIVILGDLGVGKSTFFKTIKEYVKYKKVENKNKIIEDNYLSTLIKYGNHFININIFDAPDQDEYLKFIKHSIKSANGIFLLYDITNIKSFNNLKIWMENIQNLIDIEKIPVVFIWNKLDKENDRVISEIEILNFIQSLNSSFLEISSLNINNVKSAFDTMIVNILNKIKKIQKKGNIIIVKENGLNYDKEITNNSTYILDNTKVSIERDLDTSIPILYHHDSESKSNC